MAYPPMGEIYKQFVDLLSKYVDRYNKKDKFFLAGYNIASFDNSFLRAWFIQNGDKYFGSWFWLHRIFLRNVLKWRISNREQWRKHSVSMWMIQSYMMLYMILRFVSRYVILFYLVELILFDYGEEKDKRVYSYTR